MISFADFRIFYTRLTKPQIICVPRKVHDIRHNVFIIQYVSDIFDKES